MFETLGQFDQLLTSVCGVFVGACGCWIVQRWLLQRSRTGRRSYAYSETPAITAAALAQLNGWNEAEHLLLELRETLDLVQAQQIPPKGVADLRQAQHTVRRMTNWIARQKRNIAAYDDQETAAAIKQRAAEDELVLKWLKDHPGEKLPLHGDHPHCQKQSHETQHREAHHSKEQPSAASPELALNHIASELLPFNPIAVRLTGKTAEADMSATVERIEKLLASVDPPESLGTLPAAKEPLLAIRDPQSRNNLQADDPQRRRSDQTIIYDTLLRRCLGDNDFAWRMLHKFPSRCRSELELLATEIRRRAWVSATRRITQLRGMAANLAADNLRDALANLENVCRQQSATRADQLLEAVYGEFQQVLDYLSRAEGICRLSERVQEENRPLSRWPTEMLTNAEEYTSKILELHPAVRVS